MPMLSSAVVAALTHAMSAGPPSLCSNTFARVGMSSSNTSEVRTTLCLMAITCGLNSGGRATVTPGGDQNMQGALTSIVHKELPRTRTLSRQRSSSLGKRSHCSSFSPTCTETGSAPLMDPWPRSRRCQWKAPKHQP
eukprot:724774-Amphidinium_carterae.1